MLRLIAPGGVVGVASAVLGANTASAPSPFLMLGAALLGSGLVTAWANARARRNSGEDRGAAAESVGAGAQQVAEGATLLAAPLNARIIEQTRKIAELESKLANARREEADRAIAMADQQSEMLKLQRDSVERHARDRAEVHELSAQLALAQVDLANALHEIDTLKVRMGEAGDRRGEDRRES